MHNINQRSCNIIIFFGLIILSSYSCLATEVTDVNPGKYPWVTSVRIDHSHTCVGSIISNRHVLTAGNCVAAKGSTSIDKNRLEVRVGSVNQYAAGLIVNAKLITIHPRYGNFLHNLAIVELSETLKFNERINKIDLAEVGDEIVEGSKVSIAGWSLGMNQPLSYQLKEMNMTVITSEECETQVGFGYESLICLEHSENYGICHGDQGSGIVHQNKLIGVASFSFGTCGTKFSDVSTKIPFYREWIINVTKTENDFD